MCVCAVRVWWGGACACSPVPRAGATWRERERDGGLCVCCVCGQKKKGINSKTSLTPAPPTRPPVTPRPKTRAEAMVDELLENKVPIDPIRDTTVLPTPGKSTAPVTAREAQGLMWADDLPAKGLGHAHLAIENPVWIFEKFPALKGIYEKAKEATFVRNEWLNEVRATTKKLRKGVDQDAIGRYAIAQQKGGKKLLDSMGMKVRELTPREMEVYVGIRNEYNKTFVRINRAREIAGLDPVKFTHDYSTWLRMFDKADDLGLNFSKDPAAAIHNAYEQASTMFFHPKAPGFRFGIKRARSKIPVNTRFLDVFDLYMDRASRHVVYAPAVAKARNIMRANPKSIPEGMVDPKVARRFDTVAERLPVLNTWLEGWTDFLAGSSPRVRTIGLRDLDKAARVVSKNTAAAVLSYNLRSAIIQPSSLRNTYLALGEVNTLRGIADNLSPSLRKFAMENSQVLKPRAGSGGDVHIADISSRLRVEGKRGRQAAVELGIAPLKFLDIEAARATWLGAWRRGLKLDLKGKDLYSFADDIVTKTQASALPQDIVPLQRSGVGKTFSLFNTFVIGEWNLLRHGLLKEGVYLGGPNNAATAMRFLWATAAFNALMEDGIGVRSPFPTPERALAQGIKGGGSVPEVAGNVAKELAEQLPIVGQTIRYADPTWGSRMPAVPQLGMDLVKLFAKSWGILEGKKSITTQDIRTVGTALGIPGTSQLAKYVARRKAGMSHLDAIVGVVPDKDEKKSGGYK